MVKQTATQKIKKTTIERAIETLQSVPEKPKEEVSLREAIELMRPTLKQMIGRGYNYDEVADMLKGTGIQISGATLKQYLGAKKTRKSTRLKDDQNNKSTDNGELAADKKSGKVDRLKEDTFIDKIKGVEEAKLVPKIEGEVKIRKAQSSKVAEDEFNNY
jgi:hypothetical protein